MAQDWEEELRVDPDPQDPVSQDPVMSFSIEVNLVGNHLFVHRHPVVSTGSAKHCEPEHPR